VSADGAIPDRPDLESDRFGLRWTTGEEERPDNRALRSSVAALNAIISVAA
jgi:hypothetical protein